ncbi:Hint domain-containing protein [Flexibacterium corallicola]|uniref:Hint domain-containing protein n=1 Tax=Flexibacterium corallicola TaxID=3037259 RepID=UPI00286ECB28|nr:Hint domain-containing protein [Pseudovibrio sp. M1P-2-3]
MGFWELEPDEIIEGLDGKIDLTKNRIVGYYGELSAGVDFIPNANVGPGVEGVYFRGVDTKTNEIVTAFYVGATIGAGVSPGVVDGSAGFFGFTGDPASLGGWSWGGQLNAGVTAGFSINIFGNDSNVLYFSGMSQSAGANLAMGYTASVTVGARSVYYFGPIDRQEFNSLSLAHDFIYSEINQPHGGTFIDTDFLYREAISGTDYILVQELKVYSGQQYNGAIRVKSYVTDGNGRPLEGEVAEGILQEHGVLRTEDPWFDGEGPYSAAYSFYGYNNRGEFFKTGGLCFLSGTPILMSDGQEKPIEDIAVGDLVQSYDENGNLGPGKVRHVFRNSSKHILDVFGLMVTPGHLTYCADGPLKARHVPILDILRTDGAMMSANGTLIRAATGCQVGSEGDALLWVVNGPQQADGTIKVQDMKQVRTGSRYILDDGNDVSLLDLVQAAGGIVTNEGLVQLPQSEEAMPFRWVFKGDLPQPEDYVLQRSQATLSELYAEGKWEIDPPTAKLESAHRGRPIVTRSTEEIAAGNPNIPLSFQIPHT